MTTKLTTRPRKLELIMANNEHQKNYLKSLKISQLPAWGNKDAAMVDRLARKMTSRGYCLARNSHAWLIATHPSSERTVQLELVNPSIVDLILLDEDTERVGGGFPLGGGWFTKDSAHLVDDNLDFIMNKVDTMFGLDTSAYKNLRR